jgi:two-component system, NarL family, nitrate/nitrite response regulator NarL
MADHLKIVVVDDHSLFRAGVVQALHLDDEIRVVAEGSSGSDAVDLTETHAPDLILLDISMPGNGIEAVAEIMRLPRQPRIVMLTVSESEDQIVRALEAGAVGYVLKGIDARHLIDVVKSVAAGSSFVSPNLMHLLVSSFQAKAKVNPLATLTNQEERTLRLVALGRSNRAIGEELGVLERTVKFHMTSIMRKLNVKNRVEAALMARDHWQS